MPANIGYLTAKTDKASDEVYTPAYAVRPLLKYLEMYFHPEHEIVIWCPFDKEDSEYVKIFRAEGYKVIASHIDDEGVNHNFFEYEPEEPYSFIISNPPFSCKDLILKRLHELNKPFAMLLPVPTLQGQRRFPYLKDCQALIFDKRINYYTDVTKEHVQKGVSFGSCYICKNFLPEDLIFEELEVEE